MAAVPARDSCRVKKRAGQNGRTCTWEVGWSKQIPRALAWASRKRYHYQDEEEGDWGWGGVGGQLSSLGNHTQVTNSLGLPRTLLVLALKVLCPRESPSLRKNLDGGSS